MPCSNQRRRRRRRKQRSEGTCPIYRYRNREISKYRRTHPQITVEAVLLYLLGWRKHENVLPSCLTVHVQEPLTFRSGPYVIGHWYHCCFSERTTAVCRCVVKCMCHIDFRASCSLVYTLGRPPTSSLTGWMCAPAGAEACLERCTISRPKATTTQRLIVDFHVVDMAHRTSSGLNMLLFHNNVCIHSSTSSAIQFIDSVL